MATGTIRQPDNYSLFAEQSNTLYSGKSILAGASISGSETFTKAGYYPLTISGWSASGSYSGNMILGRLYISDKAAGSVTITYNFQNGADYDLSSQGFTIRTLWIKI